jgi:hypothetical protein
MNPHKAPMYRLIFFGVLLILSQYTYSKTDYWPDNIKSECKELYTKYHEFCSGQVQPDALI